MVNVTRGAENSQMIALGPLMYATDGLVIRRTALDTGPVYYRVDAIEADSGSFDPDKALVYKYKDFQTADEERESTVVYLREEEMEALFLAWQILKEGK